ncbi:malate synthase [Pseudoalteromonas sp. MMG012]|uniref:malate synthase n=1 Tax=Pseudoalteromonas sp. MMG012 TaxID=2822686 RepID=UPI001B3A1A45|nr:malate synthase [Pseudoalteromonas sp. MMG012]MBQ4849900.1 malate synthase [Pseudoalteromonas sp. MMG012]
MTALTRSPIDNSVQGCQKLELAKRFLDEHCPLDYGSHMQTTHYVVYYNHLMAFFADGTHCGLKQPCQFVALCGHKDDPTAILLKKEDGLHVELTFNRCGNTGKSDVAHIDDIQFETALSALDNQHVQPQLKRLWVSFLTGVQHALCNTSSVKQYTAKDGSDYQLTAY